jgi:hypothetical protein
MVRGVVRLVSGTAALLCMLLLAGCGYFVIAPGAPPAVPDEQAETTLRVYRPLAPEECAALATEIENVVGVIFTTVEAPLEDNIGGGTGRGCLIEFRGTGDEVGQNFIEVSQAMGNVFRAERWMEDQGYIADGPASTLTAFRQDEALCLLHSGWTPAAEAGSGPEAYSNAEPRQQLWTISANCGRP